MSLFRRLALGLFIALSMGVGALSLAPAGTAVPVSIWDKAQHAGAYGALGFVGGLALGPSTGLAVGLTGFGAMLEAAQGFTPDRTASIADACANGLGAACGVFLTRLLRFRRRVPA